MSLLPFFMSLNQEYVYAIPGTNHVLAHNSPPKDIGRQLKYIDHIMSSVSKEIQTTPNPISKSTKEPEPTHKSQPRCFVADTDSVKFIIDTGANRIIVNDAKLAYGYKVTDAHLKGINGKPTVASGLGFINLLLKSNDGRATILKRLPVVHVPGCPYNLLPPQLLVKEMKARDFSVRHCKHDNKEYIFEYSHSKSESE